MPVLFPSLFTFTLFLQSATPADSPSVSNHWLTLESERTDKCSFNCVCIFLSHNETTAAILGKVSRAIQPRRDYGSPWQALMSHPVKRGLPGFGTRLQNFKMTNPAHSPAQNNLQEGENKKREIGVPCTATYSQFQIPFSKYRHQPLRLRMNWWELFQLSNW